MSQLIRNTIELEQAPILKSTIRKISFNPSHFISDIDRWDKDKQQRQSSLFRNLCAKLTFEEREHIKRAANEEAK